MTAIMVCMETTEQAPATIRREDAATELGVSLATVDRWRKTGILVDAPRLPAGPGRPPTREVSVYREHVDAILMARSGGATR